MQHILQEDEWGCSIACIAMLTGKSYTNMRNQVQKDFQESTIGLTKGLSYLDCYPYFIDAGYAWQIKYRVHHHNKQVDIWPPMLWAPVHWCEVQVTDSSPGHSILMLQDGTIYDPLTYNKRSLEDYYKVGVVIGLHKVH